MVLLLSTGCSFIAVTPPKSPSAGKKLVCTDHYFAPIFDTVIGAASLGLGTGLAVESAVTHCDRNDTFGLCGAFKGAFAVMGGIMLVNGLFYAIGAVYGYKHVGTCRAHGGEELRLNTK